MKYKILETEIREAAHHIAKALRAFGNDPIVQIQFTAIFANVRYISFRSTGEQCFNMNISVGYISLGCFTLHEIMNSLICLGILLFLKHPTNRRQFR